MTDKLIDLLSKVAVKPDIMLYIALGVVLVAFLVPLIAGLVGGELNAFKAAAKTALKDPSPKLVHACMAKMPVKVKKLYKRAMTGGGKPSDVIGIDACVNAPYQRSVVSKLRAATLTATLITAGAVFGIGAACGSGAKSYLIFGVTLVFGGILTLISALVSHCVYSGAVKTYDALMDVLDKMAKGDQPVENSQPEEAYEPAEVQMSPSFAEAEEAEVSVEREEPQPEQTAAEGEFYSPNVDFDGPSRITVELEDEPTVESYEPQPQQTAAVIIDQTESEEETRAKAREAAIAAARAQQAAAQAEAAARAQEQARAAAEARAAEARAAREEQIRQQQAARQAAQAAAQAESVKPEPKASTEDVIERIEKINKEGAPLATMKEVALLLQQERAKPENKTPEQQRKLNEALSKLLKAMSSANKK